MKYKGGPLDGKDTYSITSEWVTVPLAPEIKCYPDGETVMILDELDHVRIFLNTTGEQVSPVIFGTANYRLDIDRNYKYQGETWPKVPNLKDFA